VQYRLILQPEARESIEELEKTNPKKLKKVQKTLGQMEDGLQANGLNPHPYKGLKTNDGKQVYEVYVENRTPGAYRIFWHYGPNRGELTILAITPHP
jgi:mRNA-degrading endonuclease RelE of RelBE toxin-antitoxin system